MHKSRRKFNNMAMFYARKEPTTDELLKKMEPDFVARRKDVCFYRDEDCTDFVFSIPWHHTGKIRRNSKSVMYNCSRYRIKWVADVIVTKVIFRKYPEGDVIALFPDNSYRRNYMTECYQHIGQHGEGDYRGVVASTKPATPEEYADLKAELESIGYDLDVRKRAKITYRSLQC